MIQSCTRYAAALIDLLGVPWHGYAVIDRQWRVITSEIVVGKSLTAHTYGQVMPCAEAVDNQGVASLVLPNNAPPDVNFRGHLLQGVNVISGNGPVTRPVVNGS